MYIVHENLKIPSKPESLNRLIKDDNRGCLMPTCRSRNRGTTGLSGLAWDRMDRASSLTSARVTTAFSGGLALVVWGRGDLLPRGDRACLPSLRPFTWSTKSNRLSWSINGKYDYYQKSRYDFITAWVIFSLLVLLLGQTDNEWICNTFINSGFVTQLKIMQLSYYI